MPSNLELARDFYAALARADADRLRELLHPRFTGHVTDGTPAGLGGTHPGPTAMLRHVGGPVDRLFAARPAPERFLSPVDRVGGHAAVGRELAAGDRDEPGVGAAHRMLP